MTKQYVAMISNFFYALLRRHSTEIVAPEVSSKSAIVNTSNSVTESRFRKTVQSRVQWADRKQM